jgi:hypothetical protein
MADPTIQLKGKSAYSQDLSRNITFVWIDKDNPMLDSEGNTIYTQELNANGSPIPQYFEIVISIPVPYPLPGTVALRQAMVNDLKAQALEQAKMIASKRAFDIADENKIRAMVKVINDAKGTDYSGVAIVPT